MKYWLFKSEPDVYSIDDLARDDRTSWDGVRNYQARNFMTNDAKVGDQVLFYHSNANPPGIAGLGTVSRPAEPDPTQFDAKSEYFEPRATRAKPVWFCVEIAFARKFKRLITLAELREIAALRNLPLLQKGQRLSIQPVSVADFKCILKLSHR